MTTTEPYVNTAFTPQSESMFAKAWKLLLNNNTSVDNGTATQIFFTDIDWDTEFAKTTTTSTIAPTYPSAKAMSSPTIESTIFEDLSSITDFPAKTPLTSEYVSLFLDTFNFFRIIWLIKWAIVYNISIFSKF